MGETYQLYTPGDEELGDGFVELVDRAAISPCEGGGNVLVQQPETATRQNSDSVVQVGQAATRFSRVPSIFAHHDYSRVEF